MNDIREVLDNLYEGEMLVPFQSSKCNDYFITNYGRFLCVSKKKTYKCSQPYRWLKLTIPSQKNLSYHRQIRTPAGVYDVSREVGRRFLVGFKDELCVCHKNEDLPEHLVNSVWNLWMGTHGENTRDAYNKGRKTWSNQTYKHKLL